MLVHCSNSKCNTSVNAMLDPDSNEVICGDCGEVIPGVSSYSKLSMKMNGDVLRSKNRKAFVFHCATCDKHVETTFKQSKLSGKLCDGSFGECKINITDHMKKAIQETGSYLSKVEEYDNATD